MKVTWTIPVIGKRGHQEQCRSEAEAAALVLELILAGVKRHQIIVDGASQEKNNLAWAFKALGA